MESSKATVPAPQEPKARNQGGAEPLSKVAKPFTNTHTLLVSVALGVTSMSFNVWYPFLPLYALKLGATSDANALFWVAVANIAQGVTRLATGPVWGLLSDRFGRKMIFLRSLYLSSLTGAITGVISAPWQLTIALAVSGVFSGIIAPAVAFISVSVPESRLNKSLSTLSGAQYIGITAGPALGAVLAAIFGFRGAILVAAVVPLLTGAAVHLFVPKDETKQISPEDRTENKLKLEPFRMSFQFRLCILLYFVLFALNQLVRLATPIALRGIEGHKDVAGDAGLTFSLGGLTSAVSVLFLAPRIFRTGRLRFAMAASCIIAALGFVLLAIAGDKAAYIAGFVLIALVISAMTPATNALIAGNVTRSRRGTAFGVAGSAQALSFAVGPAGAALFAAFSLGLGFLVLSGLLIGLAVLLLVALREPETS